MRVAIVAVGDELLSGHTLDTNTQFLAQELHAMGARLVETRTVPDVPGRIQSAIWELQERREARVVLVCGGLGPTHDDRTVASLAVMHGVPLVEDPTTVAWMIEHTRHRYEQGARKSPAPTAAARKMTLVPRGAVVFANSVGAAPGLLVGRPARGRPEQVWTMVLPGVPSEMRAIWLEHGRDAVSRIAGDDLAVMHVRHVHIDGFESEVADILGAQQRAHPKVSIGSYPDPGEARIVVRLSCTDEALLAAAAKGLEAALVEEKIPVVPMADA